MKLETNNNQVTEEMFFEDLEAVFMELLSEEEEVKLKIDSRITTIKKAPEYSAKDIKNIREKYNYSQRTLASILNVSTRTVENWEISRSKPSGSAFRLLELLDSNNFYEQVSSREIEIF